MKIMALTPANYPKNTQNNQPAFGWTERTPARLNRAIVSRVLSNSDAELGSTIVTAAEEEERILRTIKYLLNPYKFESSVAKSLNPIETSVSGKLSTRSPINAIYRFFTKDGQIPPRDNVFITLVRREGQPSRLVYSNGVYRHDIRFDEDMPSLMEKEEHIPPLPDTIPNMTKTGKALAKSIIDDLSTRTPFETSKEWDITKQRLAAIEALEHKS